MLIVLSENKLFKKFNLTGGLFNDIDVIIYTVNLQESHVECKTFHVCVLLWDSSLWNTLLPKIIGFHMQFGDYSLGCL